jgi:hypothetical protein
MDISSIGVLDNNVFYGFFNGNIDEVKFFNSSINPIKINTCQMNNPKEKSSINFSILFYFKINF